MKRTSAIASAKVLTKEPRFQVIADILEISPKETWRVWEDDEKNLLKISKNGAVQVYPSKDPVSTKDVFKKAHPRMIAKHSYWVMVLSSKNKYVLIFLGEDGFLRCSIFEDNKWVENQSPVLLGFKLLKVIASGYIDSEPRRIQGMKITYPKCFEIEDAWVSGFPSRDSHLQEKIHCLIS